MAKEFKVQLTVDADGAITNLEDFKKEVEKSNGAAMNMRKELKTIQQLLLDIDPGDEKWKQLSDRASQIKDKMKETAEVINANASPAFESLNNNAGILSGQLSSLDFEGASMSAKAMAENIKSIDPKKLTEDFNGLLGGFKEIGSSLKTLGGSVISNLKTSFKSLGTAILANPIFLIAAAIIAVGAAIKSGLDQQRVDVDNANKAIDASNERRHREEKKRIAEAQGNEARLYEVKRDIAQKDIRDTEAKINNLTRQQRSFYGISEEQEQTLDELRKQLANQRVDYEVEAINRMNALNAARVELQTRYENIGLTSRQLTEKEMDASYKRETESLLAKGATEEELYKLDAIYEDKKNTLRRQYEAEDLAKKKAAAEEAKRIAAEKAAAIERLERAELERRKQYQAEFLNVQKTGQVQSSQEEVALKQSTNAQLATEDERLAAAKREQQTADIERLKQVGNNTLEISTQTLQGLSALTELFAGKSKKQQERAFKINKAINIAGALIDTYKSATAALATYPPPFGAIAAGASIAVGLANVAKIKAQQFNGGGGGGSVNVSSAGGSSLGGGGSNTQAGAPTFNPLNTDFLQNRPAQATQAYVLAGNVSNAQDANAKIRNLARLG